MTVDLSTLKVGDTIELRDGTKHEVREFVRSGDGYCVVTRTERESYDNSAHDAWCHDKDGRWCGGRVSGEPGDIVAIHPAPRFVCSDTVSTMREQRARAIAGVRVRPRHAVLPLATALYELHDVVLRTHSTLVNGPLEADRQRMLMCSALGLAGEAGEFTDLVKKVYEQGRVLDKDKAVKELADVAYYLQLACMALDVSVPDVVQALVAKLAARYPDGFSPEASVNRPKE